MSIKCSHHWFILLNDDTFFFEKSKTDSGAKIRIISLSISEKNSICDECVCNHSLRQLFSSILILFVCLLAYVFAIIFASLQIHFKCTVTTHFADDDSFLKYNIIIIYIRNCSDGLRLKIKFEISLIRSHWQFTKRNDNRFPKVQI